MQHDDCMASDAGIGFTDVGSGFPGTVSSQFDSATFQSWGAGFFERLSAHMSRASDSIGFVACHIQIDQAFQQCCIVLMHACNFVEQLQHRLVSMSRCRSASAECAATAMSPACI